MVQAGWRTALHRLAWEGCDRRGGLFLFLIPLVLVQLILRPFFPAEHHWADFAFTLVFFVSGYILYADERFTGAIRRDWPLMLAAGILSTLYFLVTAAAGVALEWMSTPVRRERLSTGARAWSAFR